jgi:UDP-N-acetylglucosamine 4,6-dehydratase
VSTLNGKSVLITGGTGTFGSRLVKTLLSRHDVGRVVVYSRDELKQYEMSLRYPNEPRIRFFIGDVRDADRLKRAVTGVDYIVHAAAMKQVPASEYNPFEAVKTNIMGAQNVIDAAIDMGVSRVVALSTDKACSPINLYGATKLVSDKLFVNGNAYAGRQDTRFSVVRYGNVVGSRGSVVPLFKEIAKSTDVFPITDIDTTRFWITVQQGVDFVLERLLDMQGGELFIPKIPSMKVTDLALALHPTAKFEVIGLRPGEKLHEEMVSRDDARHTVDAGSYYVIEPEASWWGRTVERGTAVPAGFTYASDTNTQWLSPDQLRTMIDAT